MEVDEDEEEEDPPVRRPPPPPPPLPPPRPPVPPLVLRRASQGWLSACSGVMRVSGLGSSSLCSRSRASGLTGTWPQPGISVP